MTDIDCLVVGLGPAGATALRDLSLAGVHAVGIDKALFPRNKPCGGALSALAQQHLDVPGWESIVEDELHIVHLALRYGESVTHEASKPICRFVMRHRFDHLLVNAAASAGADIRQGVEFIGAEPTENGVTVQTNQGYLRARCLLGCDGANSRVARSMGLSQKVCGAALEAEIDIPAHHADQWKGQVWLSYGEPDRGYGWVFPKGDHLSAGIGSFAPTKQHLRTALQRFLAHYRLSDFPMHIAGHLIPLGGTRRRVQRGAVLLAGDAAAFTDPLSGEGIAYALISGHMAARHIKEYLAGACSSFQDYQQESYRIIGSDLAQARWIANKLYTFPRAFFWLLQRSPETLALYFKLIAGEATYRQVVGHLKRKFLRFGVCLPSQTTDMLG